MTSILPTEHLHAAARDPFHTKKLREVRDAFRKAGKAVLELIPEGYTESTLEEAVLNARMNLPSTDGPELRLHFIGWINSVLPHLEMLTPFRKRIDSGSRTFCRKLSPVISVSNFVMQITLYSFLRQRIRDLVTCRLWLQMPEHPRRETILFTAVDVEHPIHGVTLHRLSAKLALEEIKKSLKL